jgi:hypothetical protein
VEVWLHGLKTIIYFMLDVMLGASTCEGSGAEG